MSKGEDKYQEGADMSSLTRLIGISVYNSNYYENQGDLLYGLSNDDNETEWYLIMGKRQPVYIGYTYTSDSNKHLHKGGGNT